MIKDEVAIRAALNRTLESPQLQGVEIDVDGFGRIEDFSSKFKPTYSENSTFLSMLFSDSLRFENSYSIYPEGNEKFSVIFYYLNSSRKDILISSLGITFSLITVLLLLISLGSRILIDRETFNQSIDAEKSKLASRIFHLMKSDIKQIINLIDTNAAISSDHRVLMKTILKSIHGTSSKFIRGEGEGVFSIDKYKIVHLKDLLEEIILRKNIEYAQKNQKLVFKNQEGASQKINSIPEELNRAISAIVDNAFDASEEDATVFINAVEQGELVNICIEDTGKGIPDNELKNILKMNYSFDKPEGNGFGLFQANEIVNALGGELKILSKLGQGTTVSISILMDSNEDSYTQEQADSFDCILIEDSKVRRLNAQKKAQLKGKRVGVFSNVKEFRDFLTKVNLKNGIAIFLDSDLGEEVSGEASAKDLFHNFGFDNITLYTAGDVEEFKKKSMPWIKNIISKDSVPSLPI